jgi:hypothetical protein
MAVILLLPTFKSQNCDDKLNEFYAAARTFAVVSSDRAGKLMDYHWTLVRLSRATLLPLGLLSLVFFIRWLSACFSSEEAVGFFLCYRFAGYYIR